MKKGSHHSDETKRKMSIARSGENHYNYGKRGKDSSFYGKKHTEATKMKMSIAKQNMSEETKRKMSLARKEYCRKRKEKMGKTKKEIKMSKTRKVYWETLENRKKIRETSLMRKLMKDDKDTSLTLKEILKEVNLHKDYFLSRVDENHSISYLNGFFGVGALKQPKDHLGTLNTLVSYSCGFNQDGSKIKKLSEQEFTLEEAEDKVEVFKVCIERFLEREK